MPAALKERLDSDTYALVQGECWNDAAERSALPRHGPVTRRDEDVATLYREFRGRAATPDALLEERGLK